MLPDIAMYRRTDKNMCAETRINMNEFQCKCKKEFCRRLSQLRINAGVSARDMSLSIGLSEGYINKLENEKTLPSMHTFFAICEYFEITPQEFFNTGAAFPLEIKIAVQELSKMSMDQLERLVGVMKDINRGR